MPGEGESRMHFAVGMLDRYPVVKFCMFYILEKHLVDILVLLSFMVILLLSFYIHGSNPQYTCEQQHRGQRSS